MEPTIVLQDGESFVGLFDRTKEVKKSVTDSYGTRYTILLVGLDGPHKNKLCTLTGGARLYEGIARVVGPADAPKVKNPTRLRFTQRGAKGTTLSNMEVALA
jgi:hypothetical protein